nr:hypothetical protein [Tanacetum cinerariifolium]
SSDTKDVAPIVANKALEMQPIGSTYEMGERCEKKRKTEMEASSSEIRKVKKRMYEIGQDLGDETNYSLVLSDRDEWKKAFYNLQAWVSKRLRWGALDARPYIGDDGPISFRESKRPKPPGSPSSSQ